MLIFFVYAFAHDGREVDRVTPTDIHHLNASLLEEKNNSFLKNFNSIADSATNICGIKDHIQSMMRAEFEGFLSNNV